MDISWAWIILFAPLVAATLILFFGKYSRILSAGLALASALTGAAGSWWLFLAGTEGTTARIAWLGENLKPFAAIALKLDQTSVTMLVLVTTIAMLVFIYSLAYMRQEEGWWRYFAGLSLFLFSMLGIVLADNLVMMFIFWELVGVSSYILIGHYFSRPAAADAAKQAFIVNRIGDFGFLLGILLIAVIADGSTIFADVEASASALSKTNLALLTTACLLLFCGTVGKSAQFPLHVWLPNSMEGPTPVSSLLHAATMVAAGVYMLVRLVPVLALSPAALAVITAIGLITCLGAALMAMQQDDIKRILAYSTISQLGIMVVGVGVAAGGVTVSGEVAYGEAPLFHLFTHAWFKCLLFLCAGSVIIAMHHEQDIWKMGGLFKKTPVTFAATLVGALALAGCPFTSGFYSKDNIIEWAYAKNQYLGWLLVVAAALTAFYITRFVCVVFFGKPRTEAAEHAHESPPAMLFSLVVLAVASLFGGNEIVQHWFFGKIPEAAKPLALVLSMKAAFVGGIVLGGLLYFRAVKDPLNIPFFANRFYIDAFYDRLVKILQDGTAAVADWFDRWIVDGLATQTPSRLAYGCGYVLRLLQSGNIQAYALLFGAGALALLYLLMK